MSNLLGHYSLILGFLISITIIFYSIYFLKKKNIIFNNILSLTFLQLIIVLISFFSLIYSFVISDFSNQTVYNHSHSTKPIFYKISGSWGNHEGSLLLWLMVLTSFLFIFVLTSKKLSNSYRLLTIFFQQIIIIGFFLFILFTSNPFELLFPIPSEGLGLNPILQDPALAIHPPILYLGYVGASIIFSSSLAALVTSNLTREWAKHIKQWIYASWMFLTIGIMLGSIWAYYELGWGGFWFWDPVENVSLMPWFCLTALLHTITVLEKKLILKSWTLILSIATFTFSMSGTFLVRSGILNSIHTFANDPSRGIFILVFLFSLIFLSIIIFFLYLKNENGPEKKIFWLSKEMALLFNNWFMMYFLSVVLIGTLYPIILEVLSNEKISIGPPFYHKLILPFLIPFLFFMAVGPNLKWMRNKIKMVNYQQIGLLIISISIAYLIFKYSEEKYPLVSFLIIFSLFLFFQSLRDFFNKKSSSQKIAHFAFSIFILSVLFNGIFSKEFSLNMRVGDQVQFLNKSIKFKSLETSEKFNYQALKGKFEITDTNNNTLIFYPEIRIYNQPSVLTSEADIKSNIFTDNYLVFNLLKDDGYFNVRYQYKPLMLYIWISIFIMSISGTLKFIRRKK